MQTAVQHCEDYHRASTSITNDANAMRFYEKHANVRHHRSATDFSPEEAKNRKYNDLCCQLGNILSGNRPYLYFVAFICIFNR